MAHPSVAAVDPLDAVTPFDLEPHLSDPGALGVRASVIASPAPEMASSPSGALVESDADVQYWYDVGFAGPDRTYPATDRALTAAQLLAVGQGWTDGRAGAPRRTVP
jgi:hypothetical protein